VEEKGRIGMGEERWVEEKGRRLRRQGRREMGGRKGAYAAIGEEERVEEKGRRLR
jgi:hypothetical protein